MQNQIWLTANHTKEIYHAKMNTRIYINDHWS